MVIILWDTKELIIRLDKVYYSQEEVQFVWEKLAQKLQKYQET